VNARIGTTLRTAALAALLVAGACGSAGDSGVQGGEGTGVETPAATDAPSPEPPSPAPPPTEPQPTAPPETAATAEPTGPAAEPSPPLGEEAAATATAEEPPAAPGPPAGAGGTRGDLLQAAEVAELVSRLAAAQAGVTSAQIEVYTSLEANFPGEPALRIEDAPLMTVTEVGDMSYAEIDVMALMGGALGGGDLGGFLPSLPPLEVIHDGAAALYVRLGPLAAFDPAGPPELPPELAERGVDLSEAWGFVDLTTEDGAGGLGSLAAAPQTALQGEFVDLLAGGLPEGALLEVRRGGTGEMAGAAVEEYTFVLDAAALEEFPDGLGGILGGPLGEPGSPADDFLGGAAVPVQYGVHVAADGLIRRMVVVLDLGGFLATGMTAMFGEADSDGGFPDDAELEVPDITYVLSTRLDTVAVNDPSLAVDLPDPSLVVDMADLVPEDEGGAF